MRAIFGWSRGLFLFDLASQECSVRGQLWIGITFQVYFNSVLQGDEILSQSLSESISKSGDSGGEEEEEGDATVPDDDEESDVVSVVVKN